jgi:hypothetical protein
MWSQYYILVRFKAAVRYDEGALPRAANAAAQGNYPVHRWEQ